MRAAALIIALTMPIAGCQTGDTDLTDYQRLHRDAFVVDLHSDAVLRLLEGADFGVRDSSGHMDIPRLKEGGIDLQVMACWLDTETPIERCRPEVDLMIDSLQAQLDKYPSQIALCTTAAQAREIASNDKIGIFIGVENGVAIANDLSNLTHFYDRGVRYLTLTHTASSDWCISSADTTPAFDGLTDFGRQVVRRMNEIGMIIDVSHASPRAVEEVLKITDDPIIASHSCVYALSKHDRNLTDEQIKAIAANGGVIGVNFFSLYLSDTLRVVLDSLFQERRAEFDSIDALYPNDQEAAREATRPIRKEIRQRAEALVPVDVGTVCDHIDYIVNLVGPDFVCLGSDFDGVTMLPAGLTDCSMVPNITKELVDRGYTEPDLKKILGENFMRIFAQVCDR